MGAPSPYTPQFNFYNYFSANPTGNFPASDLDNEFFNLETVVAEIEAFQLMIQNSNGTLAAGAAYLAPWVTATVYAVGQVVLENQIIYQCLVAHTSGTFSTDLESGDWLAVNGGTFGTYRGLWVTATAYNYRDLFIDASNNWYFVLASTGYTSSSSIATDVSNGNAVLMINQTAATASATAAASSATAAASSATSAASSATSATSSATSATSSATSATSSATTATTQAGNASTSATAAAASATSAAASAASIQPFDTNQYATSTTAANTYTATLSPAPASYATGMQVAITFTNANTGAATINLNSLGAKNIYKNGSAISAGVISASQTVYLLYDGTQFEIINPTPSSSNSTTGTVSAAGSTQSGATALSAAYSTITSATALQGVALPIGAANEVYAVNNNTAVSVYVYPVNGGGAAIDALSANAGYILGPYSSAIFSAVSSTQWYSSNRNNTVYVDYQDGSGQSLTAGAPGTGTNIKFGTKNADTHSAYNTSTGTFTAPRPGIYQVNLQLNSPSTATNGVYVGKNGASVRRLESGYALSDQAYGGSSSLLLAAGDAITFTLTNTNVTLGSDATQTWLTILGP